MQVMYNTTMLPPHIFTFAKPQPQSPKIAPSSFIWAVLACMPILMLATNRHAWRLAVKAVHSYLCVSLMGSIALLKFIGRFVSVTGWLKLKCWCIFKAAEAAYKRIERTPDMLSEAQISNGGTESNGWITVAVALTAIISQAVISIRTRRPPMVISESILVFDNGDQDLGSVLASTEDQAPEERQRHTEDMANGDDDNINTASNLEPTSDTRPVQLAPNFETPFDHGAMVCSQRVGDHVFGESLCDTLWLLLLVYADYIVNYMAQLVDATFNLYKVPLTIAFGAIIVFGGFYWALRNKATWLKKLGVIEKGFFTAYESISKALGPVPCLPTWPLFWCSFLTSFVLNAWANSSTIEKDQADEIPAVAQLEINCQDDQLETSVGADASSESDLAEVSVLEVAVSVSQALKDEAVPALELNVQTVDHDDDQDHGVEADVPTGSEPDDISVEAPLGTVEQEQLLEVEAKDHITDLNDIIGLQVDTTHSEIPAPEASEDDQIPEAAPLDLQVEVNGEADDTKFMDDIVTIGCELTPDAQVLASEEEAAAVTQILGVIMEDQPDGLNGASGGAVHEESGIYVFEDSQDCIDTGATNRDEHQDRICLVDSDEVGALEDNDQGSNSDEDSDDTVVASDGEAPISEVPPTRRSRSNKDIGGVMGELQAMMSTLRHESPLAPIDTDDASSQETLQPPNSALENVLAEFLETMNQEPVEPPAMNDPIFPRKYRRTRRGKKKNKNKNNSTNEQ